jgi:hypothetical protein
LSSQHFAFCCGSQQVARTGGLQQGALGWFGGGGVKVLSVCFSIDVPLVGLFNEVDENSREGMRTGLLVSTDTR